MLTYRICLIISPKEVLRNKASDALVCNFPKINEQYSILIAEVAYHLYSFVFKRKNSIFST